GGTAKAVFFAISAGGYRAGGSVGDGYIKHDERVYIHCALPVTDDTKAILMYRAADETSYVSVNGRERETLRHGRAGPPTSLDEQWARAYPGEKWSDADLV